MKPLLFILSLLYVITATAQKKEELFDYFFKPSNSGAYYYVVTEKEDSGWHRKAYYVSQKSLAMEGWYKDEACKVANGNMRWYHSTRFLKSQGRYVDGKKEGTWLEWTDAGQLIDSSSYKTGRRIGVSLRWHRNGMPSDSLNFDGEGNGVQVSWHDDGSLASAGRWTQDTSKKGRWKYYRNQQLLATEDYENGKNLACACFDEAGVQLDTAACAEKQATPAGGIAGWRRFLEQGLGRLLESKANSREWSVGIATVVIRFIVEKDGSLADFVPLTQYGHGIEDEVIRMLKRSPRWTPGRQWGRPVRSYHTQPVTFQIQNQ